MPPLLLWRVMNGEVPAHARYAIIFVGTNNLHSDAPIDIVDTIGAIIEILLGKNKNVIVHGIIPRDDAIRGRRFQSFRERKSCIQKVNILLQEICELYGAKLIMPSKQFTDIYGGIIDCHYFHDKLHLNSKGNLIYAQSIINLIDMYNNPPYEYAIGEPELVSAPLSCPGVFLCVFPSLCPSVSQLQESNILCIQGC